VVGPLERVDLPGVTLRDDDCINFTRADGVEGFFELADLPVQLLDLFFEVRVFTIVG
jgi:hypothetical protein